MGDFKEVLGDQIISMIVTGVIFTLLGLVAWHFLFGRH